LWVRVIPVAALMTTAASSPAVPLRVCAHLFLFVLIFSE
jgi:hypothetical protein